MGVFKVEMQTGSASKPFFPTEGATVCTHLGPTVLSTESTGGLNLHDLPGETTTGIGFTQSRCDPSGSLRSPNSGSVFKPPVLSRDMTSAP